MCAAVSRDLLSALVLVDDETLREEVHRVLRAQSFEVHLAADPPAALARLLTHRLDVLVVDEPSVCGRVQASLRSPAPIMLLVDGEADGRVAGFQAGADDCLSRPFLGRELVARLRSMARRADARKASGAVILSFADVRLDRSAHQAWRAGRELGLTPTEFELLGFLIEHAGQVIGRSRLHTEVWGYDFGPSSNSLRVYVGYLRRKLETAGEPRLLHTVRGVGYVLRNTP